LIDTGKPHYAFIECVRGYAALMVIVAHSTYLFPGLPYPVHRLAVIGWFGVQLFFLASAVTLMMSWHYELARDGAVDIPAFFLRRFFRVAPAYYAASVLYFYLTPPAGGFDFHQAASSFLFVNAWHPVSMPATPGGWSVVPGGWSIGVEFTFYAIFPLLASLITTPFRALWLLFASLAIGAAANSLLQPILVAAYDRGTTDRFLYFWFPNQMCVFALGILLFFILQRDRQDPSWLTSRPNLMALVSVLLGLSAGFLGQVQFLTLRPGVPPTFLVVSVALSGFILALAHARRGWFVNRTMSLIGRVSFSAYLLHFAVLDLASELPALHPWFGLTGWAAIVAFPFAMIGIATVVVAGSWCTYRVIEMPMIGLGKALLRGRRLAACQTLR
jgi:peptidoglycan/LPS O-acetylase OafA/YrhL